ncbi:AMP-dependent synthetase and ligase [Candidatus Sulfotelmatobacter sp. SbA7]|nr:AMP-dependent synthetase and ligase [Candidatus Sulfotelmatobacter sp. SbA7]
MSTFYDRFRECAQRWPNNVALEIQRPDRVESYTYAELRQMADSIGRWLTERKLSPGARLAILADNHPRWVAAYLGIIASGGTAVPLDTAFHADQVATLLRDSGSSMLFSDVKHLAIAREAVGKSTIGIVLLDATNAGEGPRAAQTDLDRIFAAGSGNFAPLSSAENVLASLLYTSGTTADPKGVMLAHGNLIGEVEAVFGWADIGPDDAVLGVLPLFHVLSQMANLLLPLVKGARVVYLETLNTTELLRALSERKITAFAVVPQFFYLIHERIFKEVARRGKLAQSALRVLMSVTRFGRKLGVNLGKVFFKRIHHTFGDNMRYLVTGGSRFDPKIALDFYALGIDVLQAYGLTETTGAACANLPNDNLIGSVGPPLTGVEVKILDPQPQEGVPLPVGEIALRGTIVMKGYWNRPEATAEVLKDGWLYTGDLGYLDSGNNLFITGRKKEVIILSNGKNIYPEEVEAHYLESPYIKEICVMGLEGRPGDPTADRLHAVVVPNFEVLKQRKIANAKEVIRFDIENLSTQLPSTKRIGSYEIWQEDLPRTTTRKLKRFEIAKRVKANQGKQGAEIGTERPLTEENLAWLDQPDVQRALDIIRQAGRNQAQALRPDNNLELDLGLDSMQRVELLVALEQELGGNVEESRLAEIYTVRDLVDLVRESAAGGATLARPRAGWDTLLREQTTDPEVLALTSSRPVSEAFWFLVSRVIRIAADDRFHLRVNGLEKIPSRGPFILCSNHQSFVDPLILGGLLPWTVFRDTFAVGTSEIFGSGFMRTLARWLRVVVVDPDANLVPAMRAGAFGLRHGRVLILYPEGERSIDGMPKSFKKGAAILSIHTQVPIIPVAIEGFYDAWPRGRPFQKFAPLRMKFGDAIFPPPEAEASEAAYEKLIVEVKARVVAMWEQLRGTMSTSASA